MELCPFIHEKHAMVRLSDLARGSSKRHHTQYPQPVGLWLEGSGPHQPPRLVRVDGLRGHDQKHADDREHYATGGQSEATENAPGPDFSLRTHHAPIGLLQELSRICQVPLGDRKDDDADPESPRATVPRAGRAEWRSIPATTSPHRDRDLSR